MPDKEYHPTTEITYKEAENDEHEIRLVATAIKQSKLNKIGAIYTGISVLFQAGASIIG